MSTPISDSILTTLHDVPAPTLLPGSGVMTALLEIPPGSAGAPPHRHSGPVFGYVTEGVMPFELEGEPPRPIRAGEAFSEPGGDVVHWQAANLLADGWTRFVAVMVCAPDVPMLTYLGAEEIAERQPLRDPTARDPTAHDPTARDPTARDPTAPRPGRPRPETRLTD